MTDRNTGGSAFPRTVYSSNERVMHPSGGEIAKFGSQSCEGMTLRDYFASKVLAGLCANPGGPFQRNASVGWDMTNCTDDDLATLTYRVADAMLKARAQ